MTKHVRPKTCQLRFGKAHSFTGMHVENMRWSGIKYSQSGELLGSFGIRNKWSVLNSSVIRQSTETHWSIFPRRNFLNHVWPRIFWYQRNISIEENWSSNLRYTWRLQILSSFLGIEPSIFCLLCKSSTTELQHRTCSDLAQLVFLLSHNGLGVWIHFHLLKVVSRFFVFLIFLL